MTGAFVLAVPSAEMGTMVAGVNDKCVISEAKFLQFTSDASNVFIKAVNAAEIVRVFFLPVAFHADQISRWHKVFKTLL